MRLIPLLALALLTVSPAFAQQPPPAKEPAGAPSTYVPPIDISGTWVGELYQDDGGIAEKFEFSMEIRQIGPSVKGTTYVKLDDIWAEMEFSGYIQTNGAWKISEYKVIRAEKPEALSWCMKRFQLMISFTRDGLQLTGPWWGNSEFGPCVPGSVRVARKTKRA